MLKIDDNLLQEIGLGTLPPEEKRGLLSHIYETLEMRVGMRLADQMTNEQLDEFEQYFEAKDDAGAFKWLETNFPNYKDIVNEEFEKLKGEVAGTAAQILQASQQNLAAHPLQPQIPGQQPAQYQPQPPAPQPYAAPQPPAPSYDTQAAPQQGQQPFQTAPAPTPQAWPNPATPDPYQQPVAVPQPGQGQPQYAPAPPPQSPQAPQADPYQQPAPQQPFVSPQPQPLQPPFPQQQPPTGPSSQPQ